MEARPRSGINTYVGSPIERVEDFRMLRGEGQYVGDLALPGMWHGAVLRSPMAHGRIRSLDVAEALKVPGVHAIVTAADVGPDIPIIPFRRPNTLAAAFRQPVIARDIVRYVGEPIAFVLADSAEEAEDALQEIAFDIEPLPVVADWRISASNEILLVPSNGTNQAALFQARAGDAEAAFAQAPHVIRSDFSIQRQTALPMETRGLLAVWDEEKGRLSMSGAAKLPFFNKRTMAVMLDIPEDNVDYIEFDVGGGFGARGEFYPEDFLVAFSARRFKRPVRWIEDRREHFTAIGHSRETAADLELALGVDGEILGLRGEVRVDIGAYCRPNGTTAVRNVAQCMSSAYRIPNQQVDALAYVSNKTPSGTYRGPGRYEACFFIERLLDMAAERFGFDRVELRRKNLVTAEEMPWPLATCMPNDGWGNTECDSGDFRITFERCLEEAHWSERAKLQGKLIDGKYHGLGCSAFIEGGASGPRENARIETKADGRVVVFAGSSAIGQGLETILSQIAADALEVDIGRITVLHGSTTLLKEGFGSFGSRATVMGGSAVLLAARAVLEKFRAAAAEKFGVAPDSLHIANATATAPDGRSMTLAEAGDLEADGTFANSKQTYTYGTAVAYITVDAGTGQVELKDYVVVDDVGRAINPLTLHGQVIGAAVQGLGSVFGEEIAYDREGQPLVGTLADYMVPLATDFPVLRAVTLEMFPSPNNPLGAKGAGEGGTIPVGAAIGNAVASALKEFGVEPRHLPLTPARIWELIVEAKAKPAA